MKIKLFGKDRKSVFRKRGIIIAVVMGILVTGLSGIPNTSMTEAIPYMVEAKSKKDKKKPVIKFSGKTKITVEKNKSVKIPKTTAKDNKDGNITKRIKVTVKKGKKKHSSTAKKIKNNKSVKFTSIGTYKITYTVMDKAGNKASKTRTIKVVAPKKKTTPTTEQPTTQKTTETPTTEAPTTEIPHGMYQVNVDGRVYNIIRDNSGPKLEFVDDKSDKITINIEKDYDILQFNLNNGLIKNSQYLKFLGNITATDQFGNDISDNIIIFEGSLTGGSGRELENDYTASVIDIYAEDNYGNSLKTNLTLYFRDFDRELPHEYFGPKDLLLINKNPLVYGRPRVKENNLSASYESVVKIMEE